MRIWHPTNTLNPGPSPPKPRLALQDTVSGQQQAARQASQGLVELEGLRSEVDRTALRLSEEQAKSSALRQDLATISSQHVKVRVCGGVGGGWYLACEGGWWLVPCMLRWLVGG